MIFNASARSEGAIIEFVGRAREKRRRVVMIGTVLLARHKKDRLAANQGILQQRPPPQGLELGVNRRSLPLVRRFQPLRQ